MVLKLGHHVFALVAEYSVLVFELIGVAILVYSGIKGIINFLRKDEEAALKLDEGLASALQFLLVGEIFKMVTSHGLEEIVIVAACVGLHVVLTLLIHWEIKNHKEEHANHHEHEAE